MSDKFPLDHIHLDGCGKSQTDETVRQAGWVINYALEWIEDPVRFAEFIVWARAEAAAAPSPNPSIALLLTDREMVATIRAQLLLGATLGLLAETITESWPKRGEQP